MNKLLVLSVALLSVSLYGADKKPLASLNGLEGIAKDGLDVVVADYSASDKTFDVKAIRNQVELRLRQSGIKVHELPIDPVKLRYLHVDALPVDGGGKVVGYALRIRAIRRVTFKANGKTYRDHGIIWDEGGIASVSRLRQNINKYMDKFLLDYLKANPKKKEKE